MTEQEPHSPQVALYKRFADACITADVAAMTECVDADAFFAVTPGQGRMALDQFVLLQRQLDGIVIPGSHWSWPQKVVEQGDTVVVKRYMAFTLAVDNRRIETTAIDMVTFRDGKIVELFVCFDRASTREQAFSHIV